MIGRIVLGLVVVALVVGGVLLSRGGEKPPGYKIVLDNAFGLIEGADLKAAGVKVGKIKSLEVQRGTNRALVETELLKPEFADFREDVHCSVEPQSLIGEYFLNCQPGTRGRRLPDGATIPAEQTSGTIGPDLVNNVIVVIVMSACGLLVGWRIREGILRVIQDEGYRNNLIAKGRENVKRYSLASVAGAYARLYEEVRS